MPRAIPTALRSALLPSRTIAPVQSGFNSRKAADYEGENRGALHPSVNLFRDRKPTLRGLLFPGYYKPLPPDARSKITERLKAEGVHSFGEDLFQHVRFSHEIKSDEKILARLDSFRNQYGLNRNLSFTLLLVGAMMLTRNYYAPSPEMVSYGLAALAVSLLLLYRYLKFFRQYSYEMFNHYRPRQPQRRLV